MKYKSVKNMIAYYREYYGDFDRYRIENSNKVIGLYYWWELKDMPETILELPVKTASMPSYRDQYGIRGKELLIFT